MKNRASLSVGCALLLSLGTPTFSAPSIPSNPVVASESPSSAASAYLAKSAAAHAALNSYSADTEFQVFAPVSTKKVGAKMRGRFAFQRPGKSYLSLRSYLSLKGNDSFYRAVQDGKNIYTQQNAKTYQAYDAPKEAGVVGVLASQQSYIAFKSYGLLMAGSLINGISPFADRKDLSMTLTTVKGMPQVNIKFPPSPDMIYGNVTFEFNPHTKLLRSVEVKVKSRKSSQHDKVSFSSAKLNPQLDAKLFAFVRAPGMRKADFSGLYDPSLKIGGKPHEISGPNLRGQAISLKTYKGKVVLIDFWATWCGPCIAELPNLQAAYKKYRGQGFEILSISTDEAKEPVKKFIAQRNITWPQIFDKDHAALPSTRYQVEGIPFFLLVGKDGKIAAINPQGKALDPAIKAALAK